MLNDKKDLKVALIGGGMFGGDVVLRSIEDFERCGIAPYLGRIGLENLRNIQLQVRFLIELNSEGSKPRSEINLVND